MIYLMEVSSKSKDLYTFIPVYFQKVINTYKTLNAIFYSYIESLTSISNIFNKQIKWTRISYTYFFLEVSPYLLPDKCIHFITSKLTLELLPNLLSPVLKNNTASSTWKWMKKLINKTPDTFQSN